MPNELTAQQRAEAVELARNWLACDPSPNGAFISPICRALLAFAEELEDAARLMMLAKLDCTYDSENEAANGDYGLSPDALIGITVWLGKFAARKGTP